MYTYLVIFSILQSFWSFSDQLPYMYVTITSQNVAYHTTRRTRTVLVYGPGFNSKDRPSNLGQDNNLRQEKIVRRCHL